MSGQAPCVKQQTGGRRGSCSKPARPQRVLHEDEDTGTKRGGGARGPQGRGGKRRKLQAAWPCGEGPGGRSGRWAHARQDQDLASQAAVVLGWSVRLGGAHGGGGRQSTAGREAASLKRSGKKVAGERREGVLASVWIRRGSGEATRSLNGVQPSSHGTSLQALALLCPPTPSSTFSSGHYGPRSQNPRRPMCTITTTSWEPPDLG